MFKNNLFAVKELQDLLAEKKAENKEKKRHAASAPASHSDSKFSVKSADRSAPEPRGSSADKGPANKNLQAKNSSESKSASNRLWTLKMIDQQGKTLAANFEVYIENPELYQLQVLVNGEYYPLEHCQDLELLASLPLITDPKIINATAPFCLGRHCGCVINGQRVNHKLEQGVLLKTDDNKGFIRPFINKRKGRPLTIAIRSPELRFYCNNDIVNYVAYDYKGFTKAQIKGLEEGESETQLVKILSLDPLTVGFGEDFAFTAKAVKEKSQLPIFQQSEDKFFALLREQQQQATSAPTATANQTTKVTSVTLNQEETWYKVDTSPDSELTHYLQQQDRQELENLTLGSYWLAKVLFRKEQHLRQELIFTLEHYVGNQDLYLPKLFAELRKEELPLFTLPFAAEDQDAFLQGTDQGDRKDFLHLPFVSIDGPFTTDIDDAVFALDLEEVNPTLGADSSEPSSPAHSDKSATASSWIKAQAISQEQAKQSTFYPQYLLREDRQALDEQDKQAELDKDRNFVAYQFNDPQLQEINGLVLPAQATSLLAVAIADPSYYVAKDSKTDQIAEELFVTLYLPGRNINIFPDLISEYNSTLLENKPCPSLVAFIGLDQQGEPISLNFHLAWVKVKANLVYQDDQPLITQGNKIVVDNFADSQLQSREDLVFNYRFADSYATMRKLWQQNQDYYQEIGKVNQFNNSNVKYFTAEGSKEITQTFIPPKTDSFQVIARAMLIFNQITSQYTKAAQIPTLYSVNPSFGSTAVVCKTAEPTTNIYTYGIEASKAELSQANQSENSSASDKLASALHEFKNTLVALTNDYNQVPAMLEYQEKEKILSLQQKYLNQTDSAQQESLRYNSTLLMPEPSPHFAMGQEVYATFTSPIRRFTDLVNIRNLKAKLWGLEPAYSQAELYKYISKNDYRKRNNRLMRSLETEFLNNIFKPNSDPRQDLSLIEIEQLSRKNLLQLIQRLQEANGGKLDKASVYLD